MQGSWKEASAVNHYGQMAMRWWQTHLPQQLAELDNPQEFFTNLGLEIAAEVTDLASLLAPAHLVREDYLAEVARLASARKIAEEVMMNQLVWQTEPGLPLREARAEWASTTDSWEGLIVWADRYWINDETPSTVEIEDTATLWAVPTEFVEQMLESNPPRAYFDSHPEIIAEATAIRFLREVR
jgi:hypothetical protein